jgi:hypothetical protein
LSDQYHLLVRTPRANLSRAMRQLNGVFTQRSNQRAGGNGNLFRGRYKAVLIDPDQYLGATSRFIHWLPVNEGAAKTPETYRWSSCAVQLGKASAPRWLVTKPLNKINGTRYASFLKQGVDPDTARFYSKKHLEAVRGGEVFRKKAKALASGKATASAKRGKNVPALPAILKGVASAFKVEPQYLRRSVRGRGQGNLPRQVAMSLARSPGGYSLSEIAQTLRVGHYSSVSVAAARLKTRMDKDDQLRRKVERLKSQLFSH